MTRPGIVVVGDALLDRDVEGTVERLSPDAPVPVLDETRTVDRPGGAALAARLAALSGDPVVLVTALGEDEPGRTISRLLDRAGVEVLSIALSGPTPEKIRFLAGRRPMLRLDRGGPPAPVGEISSAALNLIGDAGVVVVSDYGRGLSGRPELRRALGTRRRPTLWDPHPRGGPPAAGVTLVSPNLAELRAAFPGPVDGLRAMVERTALARRRWQARAVVTTLGPEGAVLLDGDGPPLVVPAVAAVTGDPCGAGDRFITAVASRLVHGALLTEAVTDAVAIAGAFVADGGAGSPLLTSSDGAAAPPGSPPGGVASPGSPSGVARSVVVAAPGSPPGVTRSAALGVPGPASELTHPLPAAELAARVRAAGGTVVVAGGCFDLLHAGHVSLLDAARRLGDCLIVALNSDSSVRRLKGVGRPVTPQADRAALLNALACVDAVAIFEEDSPIELLTHLRPDVFVKGGDYSSRTLPEGAALRQWGGQAVVLPYLSGRSTTRVLKEAALIPTMAPASGPGTEPGLPAGMEDGPPGG